MINKITNQNLKTNSLNPSFSATDITKLNKTKDGFVNYHGKLKQEIKVLKKIISLIEQDKFEYVGEEPATMALTTFLTYKIKAPYKGKVEFYLREDTGELPLIKYSPNKFTRYEIKYPEKESTFFYNTIFSKLIPELVEPPQPLEENVIQTQNLFLLKKD